MSRPTTAHARGLRLAAAPICQDRDCACSGRVRLWRGQRCVLEFLAIVGGRVVGERKTRAQASPQFRDGRFENVVPKTARTTAQSLDYLKRQVMGDEVRTPPPPCPSLIRLDPTDFKKPPDAGVAGNLVRACQRLSRNRRRPHHGRSDAVGVCVTASRYRAEALSSSAAGAAFAPEDGRRCHLA